MSVQRFHDAFSLDSARRRFLFKDDFLGDQLQDLWTSTGDVGGSAVVVDAQTGGIVRITTDGDNVDNWEINWNNIRTLHVNKNVCMEFRVKLTQTTNEEVRLEWQFDGNNRIRFFYSSANANWFIQCTDGGAATSQDSGIAADTDYHVFRIETSITGVSFFIDDVEVTNSPITTNIPDDAGDFLSPVLRLTTLEVAAKSMDIDYVVVSQER